MKQEIERKFLVTGDGWRALAGEGVPCCQGYLSISSAGPTVRVRRFGDQGVLTIKGPTEGISRTEFEYEIPVEEADAMLESLCDDRIVSKMRYTFVCNEMQWEVDEFDEKNKGLILAEIELESEDQPFKKPDWLGKEVSIDHRYTNAALAENPFSQRSA